MFKKQGIAVVDLETLGRFSDAVVCTLGLTVIPKSDVKTIAEMSVEEGFKYCLENTLSLKFDIRAQFLAGRKIEKKVREEFWDKQPMEIRTAALKPSEDDHEVTTLFKSVEEFLRSKNFHWRDVAFTDRQFFDMSKLEHIHQCTLGSTDYVPWDHREYVELSQLFRILADCRYGGIRPEDLNPEIFKYHISSHDAALDMVRLCKVIAPGI